MAVPGGWQQSETDNIFGDPRLGPDSPHCRCSREVLSNSWGTRISHSGTQTQRMDPDVLPATV